MNELTQAFDIGFLLGVSLFLILTRHGIVEQLLIWMEKKLLN